MSYFGVSTRNGVGLGLGTVPSLTNTPLGYRLAPSLDLSFAGSDALSPAITFSRTTNATLTNSAGLIANAPMNLLTFSEQFDNAAWSKTRASISANTTAAPDGTTTADKLVEDTSASNTHQAFRSTSVSAGTPHTFSVYIKADGRNFAGVKYENTGSTEFYQVNVNLTNGTATTASFGSPTGTSFSVTSAGNAWWRVSITVTTSNTGFQSVVYLQSVQGSNNYTGDGVSGAFIWGAQLELGSTATTYNPTTVKNLLGFTENFDNAAWTKSNSFVQTNLVLQSEAFDTASWSKTRSSITANIVVAPDGTMTGDKLVENTDTNTHLVTQIVSLGGSVDSSAYNISVYVKAGERTRIRLRDVQQTTTGSTTFDLITGTVVTGTGTITAVGNDWYRCTIFPLKNNSTSSGVEFALVESGTTTSYTGDGTSGLFIWGAQLVQGTTPGDYKATYSAAAAVGYTDIYGQPFAQKLVESATTSGHLIASANVTVVAATPITLFAYVKSAERNWVILYEIASASGRFFDVSTGVKGSAFGSAPLSDSITPVGNGWYLVSITVAAAGTSAAMRIYTATANGASSYTGDGTSGIYIFGAQLSDSASVDPYVYQPVAAPTSTAYYGPRFDYDPVTLAPKGLLIEEQRTNLLTYSEQFDNAAWTKTNSTITVNATTAPDGTATADLMVETVDTGIHRLSRSLGVLSAQSLTISIRHKAGIGTRNLDVAIATSTNYVDTIFSSTTGVVVAETDVPGAVFSGKRNTFSGPDAQGFYTATITVNLLSTQTISVIYGLANNASNSYTGDGTSGIFVWGAQLEAGAFATSYIPTVASQVTRAADSASMIGNNSARWYNQTEGALFAEYAAVASSIRTVFAINDGTANESVRLRTDSTNPLFTVTDGGVDQANIDAGTVASNTTYKFAGAYALNSFAASIAGGAAVTDTSGSLPTVNRAMLGNSSSGNYLNGTIKRIAYYNRRLSNTELQGLTS